MSDVFARHLRSHKLFQTCLQATYLAILASAFASWFNGSGGTIVVNVSDHHILYLRVFNYYQNCWNYETFCMSKNLTIFWFGRRVLNTFGRSLLSIQFFQHIKSWKKYIEKKQFLKVLLIYLFSWNFEDYLQRPIVETVLKQRHCRKSFDNVENLWKQGRFVRCQMPLVSVVTKVRCLFLVNHKARKIKCKGSMFLNNIFCMNDFWYNLCVYLNIICQHHD